MIEAILTTEDEGLNVTVAVPIEQADEDDVFIEIRHADGREFCLIGLPPQGALQTAMALIASVEASGVMELAKEALYPAS